ncbi:maleylpyruvate isomerase N-terminal domain-containing protein [Terrabacter sp. BE26]|uniref:maleylpyruvate isomerase N-terminal domain-containing protein n=1 Tax=Terrabacter sp. BE26 TaxID=2898152 RepID=UPI0035BE6762
MRQLSFPHEQAVERLGRQVREFVAAVGSAGDLELLGPSPCHGWSRLDVVVHVRMGLQEMALGTVAGRAEEPDRDAASYWADHQDDRDDDPVAHILWLRRTAAAYSRPAAAVTHLRDVADFAVRAVQTMPEGTVAFQGKHLRSGDFLATWVVELAVHQLDLDLAEDSPSGLAWTRATLEAVAGAELPAALDDRDAVLVGLGRQQPPPSAQPGPAFPVSL